MPDVYSPHSLNKEIKRFDDGYDGPLTLATGCAGADHFYLGENTMSDAEEEAPDAQRTRTSRPYLKAQNRATEYIRSPVKLRKLADDAKEKAGGRKGPLDEVRESLFTFLRMIRAYADGSYRQVSWKSLLMIVASVVYFVMPFDLIPDFIITFGLLDDAALLTWTAKAFKKELDDFVAWENRSTTRHI